MKTNKIKERLNAGLRCYGVISNLPSGQIIEATGFLGLDFVLIDAEHSSMDPQVCENLVRAADAVGIASLIRVPQIEPKVILRYVDTGVGGIVIPGVRSPQGIEIGYKAIKFPPEGCRSVGVGRWADYGLTGSLIERSASSNRETMLVAQIETREAVDCLDDLLNTNLVDLFFIGPTDLAEVVGEYGQPTHPEVQRLIEQLVDRVHAAGQKVGCQAYTPKEVQRYKKIDMDVVTMGALGLYVSGCRGFLTVCGNLSASDSRETSISR